MLHEHFQPTPAESLARLRWEYQVLRGLIHLRVIGVLQGVWCDDSCPRVRWAEYGEIETLPWNTAAELVQVRKEPGSVIITHEEKRRA